LGKNLRKPQGDFFLLTLYICNSAIHFYKYS